MPPGYDINAPVPVRLARLPAPAQASAPPVAPVDTGPAPL